MKIKIITCSDPTAFEAGVNAVLKDSGWKLHGHATICFPVIQQGWGDGTSSAHVESFYSQVLVSESPQTP